MVIEKVRLPTPQDIRLDFGGTCGGRFGYSEVEHSAGRLVQFFQQQGNWNPTPVSNIREFYATKGWNPDAVFYGLAGLWIHIAPMCPEYIETHPCVVFDEKGNFCVTVEFIERCAGVYRRPPTKLDDLSREEIERRLRLTLASLDEQVKGCSQAVGQRSESAKRFADESRADLFVQVAEDRLLASQGARARFLEHFPFLVEVQ